MGFDLIGRNPQNENGEYFRNNVWYWRPLAQYVLEETKVVDKKDQDHWHYNDCYEVPKDQAIQIANQLDFLIKKGHTKKFASAWELRRKQLEKSNKVIEKELDNHVKEVRRRLNNSNLAPADFPKPDKEKWDMIYKKKNSDEYYPFTIENVKEFSEFCRNSGGFTIG